MIIHYWGDQSGTHYYTSAEAARRSLLALLKDGETDTPLSDIQSEDVIKLLERMDSEHEQALLEKERLQEKLLDIESANQDLLSDLCDAREYISRQRGFPVSVSNQGFERYRVTYGGHIIAYNGSLLFTAREYYNEILNYIRIGAYPDRRVVLLEKVVKPDAPRDQTGSFIYSSEFINYGYIELDKHEGPTE